MASHRRHARDRRPHHVGAAHGARRRATASGQDIYAVTAPLFGSAALSLLADGATPCVRGPGEVFEARTFLELLAPDIEITLATA